MAKVEAIKRTKIRRAKRVQLHKENKEWDIWPKDDDIINKEDRVMNKRIVVNHRKIMKMRNI